MLDESLIEFNAAVENQNYAHAISILEPLVLNFEIEGMWRELGKIALEKSDLISAERCYAAIGDAAYACYLHKETEMQLLEHSHVTEALRIYMECHRWNEAIFVAKSNNDVDTKNLCENYHKWLLQTCQVEEAAKLQEAKGNLLGAITLFLDSGLPGHAADCVEQHSSYPFQYGVLERLTEELEQAGMFKKAGKLLERLGHAERAKEAYHKGHVYEPLLDLVQRKFPDELVSLKNEWGDWLASQYQVDTAIDHYIAAGFSAKAIESAISSHQWAKAVQILETQNTEVAFPFYKRLAQHFEGSNQYAEAEQFYIAAKLPDDALRMYIQANIWEDAFKVARKYLSEGRASALYLQRASELEALRYFSEAEKLYLESRNVDLAINMYKKARAYEHMIRLVTEHRKDLLTETHLRLAQQLESEGLLEDAEQHYLEAEDWKSTVKMYVANGMWKDSMRIAKTFGGPNGAKQVAYAWAVSLGGEAGAQLLAKLGLVEQAIEYAIEVGAYDHAFDLCHSSLKHKLPEVHLRYAMFLEDEGRFGEAENEFIKGGKPREAIDMYIHQQDWQAAVKVADLCEPAAVTDIQLAQAELFLKQNELEKAEALFLLAKKTEFALNMYKEYNRWEDAIRIAKDHMPSLIPELNQDFASFMKRSG
ncbi:hypothetical protein O6H91_18G079000 [Diphasiastrum complanatum]|uniref:Uncharacterized protein n=1 Tax=Diphasiastrum complanatum TaxID=34168 RepID=A0ACC2B457_DIPCM|nr:hypothetical protein O6H91_18G079000 [Diphasiastrum complanatum]